jgi:hypothetical protein
VHLQALLFRETVLLAFAPGSLAQVLVEVGKCSAAAGHLAGCLSASLRDIQGALTLDDVWSAICLRRSLGAPVAACGDENRRAEERLRVHGDCLGMQNQPFEAIKREPHVHPVVSGR